MNKKLLIAIFAVFLVGGAMFTYALSQSEEVTKEEVEVYKEAVCSGNCDGTCGGECGAADCGCQQNKVASCGSSCPYAESCGVTPGACGSPSCSGGCSR